MRDLYHGQLEAIVDDLVALAHAVQRATHDATGALLTADAALAERVIAEDAAIDQKREEIEERTFELMALQQPVATDLRMLVAGLRMVAELERMGDLAVHIAKVARMRYPDRAVPPALHDTVCEMAETTEEMVGTAAEVIENRDVEVARRLEVDDERIDRMRRSILETLLSDDWAGGVEPAIDIALLGRYYERLADHAVSIGRRLVYLVTGDKPAHVG
jgi:phosphate transport system protein